MARKTQTCTAVSASLGKFLLRIRISKRCFNEKTQAADPGAGLRRISNLYFPRSLRNNLEFCQAHLLISQPAAFGDITEVHVSFVIVAELAVGKFVPQSLPSDFVFCRSRLLTPQRA